MFKNYLFILDLKIIKYKKIYIYPLQRLQSMKKIKYQDYHRNIINEKYWILMKYYAYLLNFNK